MVQMLKFGTVFILASTTNPLKIHFYWF